MTHDERTAWAVGRAEENAEPPWQVQLLDAINAANAASLNGALQRLDVESGAIPPDCAAAESGHASAGGYFLEALEANPRAHCRGLVRDFRKLLRRAHQLRLGGRSSFRDVDRVSAELRRHRATLARIRCRALALARTGVQIRRTWLLQVDAFEIRPAGVYRAPRRCRERRRPVRRASGTRGDPPDDPDDPDAHAASSAVAREGLDR